MTDVVVDLDYVTLIDAAGLRVLADGQRHALARGRQFHLVNPHSIVAHVIEAVRLDTAVTADLVP